MYWVHMYDMGGAWDKAIAHWTTALQLDPNAEYFMERRAIAYDVGLHVQDQKEIETTLRAAVARAPGNDVLRSFLSERYPQQPR